MEESEGEYYWLFLASIVLPTTLDSRRPSFAGQEGHGTHPTHIEGREGQSVHSEKKRGTRACGTKAANRQYKVPGQSLALSLSRIGQAWDPSSQECRDDERPLYVIRTREA